jgi:UDP-glucuronate 4-epimerase
MKKILVTGAAGFIGMHVSLSLLQKGYFVIGLDNMNNYYDPALKKARLDRIQTSENCKNFHFLFADLTDASFVRSVFIDHEFDNVIHLAAQAGVRYSLENPQAYISSNVTGFVNILEGLRQQPKAHLIYASSSSVYGGNKKVPFAENDRVDSPISLYASTKKSNELLAHTYSHLFSIPTTGLRFFTVYGPWGRPDMAAYIFTKSIVMGQAINVFNYGNMERDFTYIDDIASGVISLIDNPPKIEHLQAQGTLEKTAPYRVLNIGNNNPRKLVDLITTIEKHLKKKAKLNLLPLQPGDVPVTYADIKALYDLTGFTPSTSLEVGIEKFIQWFKAYHKT